MKTAICVFLVVGLLVPVTTDSRPTRANPRPSGLQIRFDRPSQNVVVWWEGSGRLRKVSLGNPRPTRMVRGSSRRLNIAIEQANGSGAFYLLDEPSGGGGPIVTPAVGYVILSLPPGLSLIANPLFHPENMLEDWMPNVPDGSQVYKLLEGGGYEVSTFDALAGGWSNPDVDLLIGTGFYFFNPSGDVVEVVFYGHVLQGHLVNPLPAGVSLKGALVPQKGSINTMHNVPGEPGDVLRLYINDQQGGGAYTVSTYVDGEGWVPDCILDVGQGFCIEKQRAQDWLRDFSVF